MLPHHARLRRAAEFTDTTRRGVRAGGPLLVVHLRAGEPSQSSRAGFVVSRTVGSAVTRNHVRRRLRHLVRDRLDSLPAGTNLVIRATPAAGTASGAALGAELDRALTRLSARVGRS